MEQEADNKQNRVITLLISVLLVTSLLLFLKDIFAYRYDPSVILRAQWGEGRGEFGLIEKEDFLTGPTNFIIDYSGNVIVADVINLRVQKFNSRGDFITKANFIPVDREEPLIVHYLTCDRKDNFYALILDCEANLVKFSKEGKKLFLKKYPVFEGENALVPPLDLFRADLEGMIYISERSGKRSLKIFHPDGEFDREIRVEGNVSVSPSGEIYVFREKGGYVHCTVYDKGGNLVRRFRTTIEMGGKLTSLKPGDIYFTKAGEIYFPYNDGEHYFVRGLTRDGQFLKDYTVGRVNNGEFRKPFIRGPWGWSESRGVPLNVQVDYSGNIYCGRMERKGFSVMKFTKKHYGSRAVFEGKGSAYDAALDDENRIHILTGDSIYLFEPGLGLREAFPIPGKGKFRKFSYERRRGYVVFEAEQGGLLFLTPRGEVTNRVPVMKMRGMEVKGFRRFIEKDGGVFADFGLRKVYRIDEEGELQFSLNIDDLLKARDSYVRLTKAGLLRGGYYEEDRFDSYTVVDENGDVIGDYEFCSDNVIEHVKKVGEDVSRNIYVWCSLSKGSLLHLWSRDEGLAEVLSFDDPVGPLKWSDIIVTKKGEIFRVVNRTEGFELIRYDMPAYK